MKQSSNVLALLLGSASAIRKQPKDNSLFLNGINDSEMAYGIQEFNQVPVVN